MKRYGALGVTVALIGAGGVAGTTVASASAAKPAAGTSKSKSTSKAKGNAKKVKPKVVKVSCTSHLSSQAPAGQSAFVPGTTQGTMFGKVRCHGYLHSGVEYLSYQVDDVDNMIGTYKQFFDGGTVSGKFLLGPVDSTQPPTGNDAFASQTFSGRLEVLKGTGAFKGVREKKAGTGTCSTTDGVHWTCTEQIRLVEPVSAAGS